MIMLTSDYLYSLSSDMKVLWQCSVSEIKEISFDPKQVLVVKVKVGKGCRFQFPEEGN